MNVFKYAELKNMKLIAFYKIKYFWKLIISWPNFSLISKLVNWKKNKTFELLKMKIELKVSNFIIK